MTAQTMPFVAHVDLAGPDRPFAPAFWMEHDRRVPALDPRRVSC